MTRQGIKLDSGLAHIASGSADSTRTQAEGENGHAGLAAVGQRFIDSTAKMMIKRFFDKLVNS